MQDSKTKYPIATGLVTKRLATKLRRRPNQVLINTVFEKMVRTVQTTSITRATLPVLFLASVWGSVFSLQFSRLDADLAWNHTMRSISPLGSLPDLFAPTPYIEMLSAGKSEKILLSKPQQNLVRQLSLLYRVNSEDLARYVVGAYGAAREFKVDPLLVLAIMSIESSFNPVAQSQAGAQGLMQVLTRVHPEKFAPFGGVQAAFDITANIHVGTRIIKDYIAREGTIEGALKSYVGAALMSDDGGYGYKVMSQMERLKAIAAGRPIPNIPNRKPETLVAKATQGNEGDLQLLLVDTNANQPSIVDTIASPKLANIPQAAASHTTASHAAGIQTTGARAEPTNSAEASVSEI